MTDPRIHKAWLWYIGILVLSAGFMVYGLSDFIAQMHLGAVRVVTSLLTVVSNVLLVDRMPLCQDLDFRFGRRRLADPVVSLDVV